MEIYHFFQGTILLFYIRYCHIKQWLSQFLTMAFSEINFFITTQCTYMMYITKASPAINLRLFKKTLILFYCFFFVHLYCRTMVCNNVDDILCIHHFNTTATTKRAQFSLLMSQGPIPSVSFLYAG